MKTSFVLVIYECVPDESKVALIPSTELSSAFRQTFDLLDGKMINSDSLDLKVQANQDAAMLISDEFYDGPLSKYFVERGVVMSERDILIERIYRIGQYL